MSHGLELEYARVKTSRGESRGLVFRLAKSFVLKRPIGPYAAKVRTFESEAKLDAWLRQRRWVLEKVRWFS